MEKDEDVPRRNLYDAVATRIGNRLHELKVQVDSLAIEQEMQLKTDSTHSMERASGILQQVDWELFGMGNSMFVHEDSKQRQEKLVLPNTNVTQPQQSNSEQNLKMGFSYRVRGYMDQVELRSFAARGLFMNHGTKSSAGYTDIAPLKAWKHFLEANVLRHWNYC